MAPNASALSLLRAAREAPLPVLLILDPVAKAAPWSLGVARSAATLQVREPGRSGGEDSVKSVIENAIRFQRVQFIVRCAEGPGPPSCLDEQTLEGEVRALHQSLGVLGARHVAVMVAWYDLTSLQFVPSVTQTPISLMNALFSDQPA